VGIAATANGRGYWMVASDGGIFAFGNARFYGSTGTARINRPIVGIAATADGRGYWMVASDGGVFGFGDAHFYGSASAEGLQTVVGISG
jgi:ribosomal protein L24E